VSVRTTWYLIVGCAGALIALPGCKPDYSPNTYASNAAQQAAKVDQGIVVGVRDVAVSANTTAGAVTGGAAGGIAGSQIGSGVTSAFGALGGAVLGSVAGSAAEHVQGDTTAYEYIVRKTNGDLVSVTQKDIEPLKIGQRVLVIAGQQARIVPDYTVPVAAANAAKPAEPPSVPPVVAPAAAPVPPVPAPLPPTPPTSPADPTTAPPTPAK
jgi:outer membrane lipoprotein SlyB